MQVVFIRAYIKIMYDIVLYPSPPNMSHDLWTPGTDAVNGAVAHYFVLCVFKPVDRLLFRGQRWKLCFCLWDRIML